MTEPINPSDGRYIKLGQGGEIADACLNDGKLGLFYESLSHNAALANDRDKLRREAIEKLGRSDSGTATRDADQVLDFYHATKSTLWITFHNGDLWWCFADDGVSLEPDRSSYGYRTREVLAPWQNTDIEGNPIRLSDLSGAITQTAGYQGTICRLRSLDAVVRVINAEQHPAAISIKECQTALSRHLLTLIRTLTPKDFELLVDLVIGRLGWRRTGAVGGPQKTVDLEIEQPLTGERAFVQVKSRSNQSELDDYVQRFEAFGTDRMFYVWHSGPDLTSQNPQVLLLGPEDLVRLVRSAGLTEWVLRKTR
ncbi:MAG: hypothetical protein H2040_08190 [Euryhalocaulis sp.]|uniref:restriction endonuclease n=1 Tax=Euryhalocaulis sp. TaxID=2744307 RepID=UPI0018352C29|nr:hypothetical protein [Euryhalocaulis sp.]MBA4801831.1 hypothetical protein [Euryhalocaulis sp.]